ncbi:hypothetical protein SAMN05216349_10637 [Oribacterium sp. KHPX15]|uniref:hypothetical protein n=1 Tax=Oribacterium sp. KHPX15 TaxID=1855342 RepID=UPI0008944193|nr:hypothetical protein [Oribacterium sp. KHPX15]SEA17802.1 hypothetical protein SAMN05216349_10637 [Oribacterium sp. KHPX15]
MNYPVITLCGSTRFKDEFIEAQKRLTLEISVGLFGHSGDQEVCDGMEWMKALSQKRKRCWMTCTNERSIWQILFM